MRNRKSSSQLGSLSVGGRGGALADIWDRDSGPGSDQVRLPEPNSFEVETGMNREDELRPMALFVVALLVLLLVVA